MPGRVIINYGVKNTDKSLYHRPIRESCNLSGESGSILDN